MLKRETKETKHKTNTLPAIYWSITVEVKKKSTGVQNNTVFHCIIDPEMGTR